MEASKSGLAKDASLRLPSNEEPPFEPEFRDAPPGFRKEQLSGE
jgi:hypothetical protein